MPGGTDGVGAAAGPTVIHGAVIVGGDDRLAQRAVAVGVVLVVGGVDVIVAARAAGAGNSAEASG